jgi:hypothetical protein
MCPDLDLTYKVMKYGYAIETQFEEENCLKYHSRKSYGEAPEVYNHLFILNPKSPTLSSQSVPALQKNTSLHFYHCCGSGSRSAKICIDLKLAKINK